MARDTRHAARYDGRALVWFLVLGSFCVIGFIGAVQVLRKPWSLRQVAGLVSASLSQAVGTDVIFKDISGNLRTGLTVHGLSLGKEFRSPTGFLLSAERVRVFFEPGAWRRRKDLSHSITRLSFERPYLFVFRDEKGVWNFSQIFKPRRPEKPMEFRTDVVFEGGILIYRDALWKDEKGKPFEARFKDVCGNLKPLELHAARFSFAGKEVTGKLKRASAEGTWRSVPFDLKLKMSLSDADIAKMPPKLKQLASGKPFDRGRTQVLVQKGILDSSLELQTRDTGHGTRDTGHGTRDTKAKLQAVLRGGAFVFPKQHATLDDLNLRSAVQFRSRGRRVTDGQLEFATLRPHQKLGTLLLRSDWNAGTVRWSVRALQTDLDALKKLSPTLVRLPAKVALGRLDFEAQGEFNREKRPAKGRVRFATLNPHPKFGAIQLHLGWLAGSVDWQLKVKGAEFDALKKLCPPSVRVPLEVAAWRVDFEVQGRHAKGKPARTHLEGKVTFPAGSIFFRTGDIGHGSGGTMRLRHARLHSRFSLDLTDRQWQQVEVSGMVRLPRLMLRQKGKPLIRLSSAQASLSFQGKPIKGGHGVRGSLQLTDATVSAPPLEKSLKLTHGKVTFSGTVPAAKGARPEPVEGQVQLTGSLRAEAKLAAPQKPQPEVKVDAKAFAPRGLNIAARFESMPAEIWKSLPLENLPFTILSGRVSGGATVRLVRMANGKWRMANGNQSVRATLNLERVSAFEPRHNLRLRGITGKVEVFDDVVQLHDVSFESGGTKGVAGGTILLGGEPRLALEVMSPQAEPELVWSLLQPHLDLARLVDVQAKSEGSLSLKVMGSLRQPLVHASAQAPSLWVRHRQLGLLSFSAARWEFELISRQPFLATLSSPKVLVDATGFELAVAMRLQHPLPVQPSSSMELQNLNLTLAASPQFECDVSTDRLLAFNTAALDVRGHVLYRDGTLFVERIGAQVFEGGVEDGVLVMVAKEPISMRFRAQVQSVNAAAALQSLGLTQQKWELSGRASGLVICQSDEKSVALRMEQRLKDWQAIISPRVNESKSQRADGGRWTVGSGQGALRGQFQIERRDDRWHLASATGFFQAQMPSISQITNHEPRTASLQVQSSAGRFDYDGQKLSFSEVEGKVWDGSYRGELVYDLGTKQWQGHLVGAKIDLKEVGEFVKTLSTSSGQAPFEGGRLDAQFQLGGTTSSPVVTGKLFAFNARWKETPIGYARVAFRWEKDKVQISELVARDGGAFLSARGGVDDIDYEKDDGKLSFKGQVSGVDLGEWAQRLQLSDSMDGLAKGNFEVSGTWQKPVVQANLDIALPQVKEFMFERASAEGFYADDAVHVRNFTAQLGDGTFRLSGDIKGLKEQKVLNLAFRAEGLELRRLLQERLNHGTFPLGGVLQTMDGKVTGTSDQPLIEVEAKTSQLALGEVKIGEGVLKGRYVDGHFSFEPPSDAIVPTRLTAPQGVLELTGTIPMKREGRFDAKVKIQSIPLPWLERLALKWQQTAGDKEKLLPEWAEKALAWYRSLPHPVEGMAGGEVQIQGDFDAPTLNAKLDVKDISIARTATYQLSSKLSWEGKRLEMRPLLIAHQKGTLAVEGQVEGEGQLQLLLTGKGLTKQALLPWWKAERLDFGITSFDAYVQGTLESPRIVGSMMILNPSHGGFRADRLLVRRFALQEDELEVQEGDMVLEVGEQEAKIWGKLPLRLALAETSQQANQPTSRLSIPTDRPIDLHLFFKEVPISLFTVGARSLQEMEGTFSTHLIATGTLQEPEFSGYVLLSAKQPVRKGRAGGEESVEVLLKPQGRKVKFEQAIFKRDEEQIQLAGSVLLGRDGLLHPSANTFDLTLTGKNIAVRSGGVVLPNMNFEFALRNSEDGTPVLQLLSLRAGEVGNEIHGSGMVELDKEAFWEWSSLHPDRLAEALFLKKSRFDLHIDLNRVPVRYGSFFKGKVTGSLELISPQLISPQLITFKPSAPPVLRSDPAAPLIVIHDARLRAVPGGGEGKPWRLEKPFIAFESKPDQGPLRIVTGKDVAMRNELLDIPLEGELTLEGDLSKPRLSGKFESERGSWRFPATRARLTETAIILSGQLDNKGVFKVDAELYAHAEAKVRHFRTGQTYQITIDQSGPLDPQRQQEARRLGREEVGLRLSSTPPLPEHQIFELLMGVPVTEVTSALARGQLPQGAQTQLVQAFVGAAVSPLEKQFRELGIEFIFEPELEQRRHRIGLGFEPVPGFFFSIRRELTGRGIPEWEAQYFFTKRTSLSFSRDERERSEVRAQFGIEF